MTNETAATGFHPTGRAYRFTVLGFASLILFGSYFAYDSVAAMDEALRTAFNVGREQIGQMYTAYSVAAIISVLLGGFLIDRIGTRKASLLFSFLVTAGAAIVAYSPSIGSIWVLFLGRLVFGMASESLVVAQNAILARWFTGKELALSFGIALTVSRMGTLLTLNTVPLIERTSGVRGALWVAAGLCFASLLCNVVYNVMDKKAERPLGLAETAAGDKVVFSDIARFRPSYWLVALLCVTFYSAIFPFTALSTDLFHEKWGLPKATGEGLGFWGGTVYNITHMFSTAQGTTGIIITASMFCAPFAGRLVDKIGKRATLMAVGSLLMIPAHLAMGLTHIQPAICMIVLGAAFVLVPAAMWPAVPLVVEKEKVGTAYGLMTMIQNVGLALFPWANGKLRDVTQGYTASQVMFACLGGAGLIFALLLYRADRKAGGVLERGGSEGA